jgi:hypothetical protein
LVGGAADGRKNADDENGTNRMMMILASLVVLHALLVEHFLVMVGSNRWKLQYSIHHNNIYDCRVDDVDTVSCWQHHLRIRSWMWQWCFRCQRCSGRQKISIDLGLEEKSM